MKINLLFLGLFQLLTNFTWSSPMREIALPADLGGILPTSGVFPSQSSISPKNQCEAQFVRFHYIVSFHSFFAHPQPDDGI